jgi:hypothetical protein
MPNIANIIKRLRNNHDGLEIKLNPPACSAEIQQLEALIQQKLPHDISAFYQLTNGFETNDFIFRMLSIAEMIKYKHELPKNRLYLAEYLIYSETWDILLDTENTDKYNIVYDLSSDDTIILTNSLFEFLTQYLSNGGIFGEKGLCFWSAAQKSQYF